ncbi:unnamed protein product [Amoebophrya sp. A120]|nr:unnamed protein product [Amoebophrya sp. A120]|eukprot:GSA120T00002074001.1
MIPASLYCTVHIAYYLWYGNPVHDGKWMHWDHKTLPHWDPKVDQRHEHKTRHAPEQDRGHAKYRPLRGWYSSRDSAVMEEHMRELASMDIDSFMFSWWGRPDVSKRDDADSGADTDQLVDMALQLGAKRGVKFSFHVEPYGGRSPETFRQDGEYIAQKYLTALKSTSSPKSEGSSEHQNLAFFVYDVSSRHTPNLQEKLEWRQTLEYLRKLFTETYQVTPYFFCLWIENMRDVVFVKEVGFDGGYSYFAANGFTPASSPAANWEQMPVDHFVPSVGPGYDDVRIRPWNAHNVRPRRESAYYDDMWQRAMPFNMVTITSYNEWGESTQIEPAFDFKNVSSAGAVDEEALGSAALASASSSASSYYDQYPENNAYFYTDRTRAWVQRYKAECRNRLGIDSDDRVVDSGKNLADKKAEEL